jgi:hypothetical protein
MTLTPVIRRPTLFLCLFTPVMTCLGFGCTDPRTDGSYWRQPAAKPRVRSVSMLVGTFGDTADYSVGPGFDVSGAWGESGGAGVGRFGTTAGESVWPERAASTGDVYDARRYGMLGETLRRPSVAGTSSQSGSFPETGARSGVTPVER